MKEKVMTTLHEKIKLYGELALNIKQEAIDIMRDKSRSIEERWDVLKTLTGKGMLKTELYSDGHTDVFGNRFCLDMIYIDRGQTTTYVSMLNRLQDKKV